MNVRGMCIMEINMKRNEPLSNVGQLCCGCMACYSVCPRRAISMFEDYRGFEYPDIDLNKCIHCYKCDSVCPIESTSCSIN